KADFPFISIQPPIQKLGDVEYLHRLPPAAQPSTQVHQAAHIRTQEKIDPGGQDVIHLLIGHGRGYSAHFDGEGAAEPAAVFRVRKRLQGQAPDMGQEPEGSLRHLKLTTHVTGMMVNGRSLEAGSEINQSPLNQELGKLETPSRQML